jgi:hypothetical protein
MATFTFRVPEHWAGRLDSKRVQKWLQEYLKRPVLLPPDPGAGKLRISISLSDETSKIIHSVKEGPISASLRRIISKHIDQSVRTKPNQSSHECLRPGDSDPGKKCQTRSDPPRNSNLPVLDPGVMQDSLSFGTVRYVMGVGFPRLKGSIRPGETSIAPSGTAVSNHVPMTPTIPPLIIVMSIVFILAIFGWVFSRNSSPTLDG